MSLLRFMVIFMTVMTMFSQATLRAGGVMERSEVDEKLTWDVSDLYENKQAWVDQKEALTKQLEEFDAFKGHVTESADKLFELCRFMSDYQKELYRLHAYSARLSDSDLRVSEYQEMKQEVSFLLVKVGEKTSFVVPEIVAAGEEKIRGFIKEKPELDEFRVVLEDMLRKAPHTLSESEERIMASSGQLSGAPYQLYSIFADTEMPRPEVTLSTGETVKLTAPNYVKYRSVPNQEDRAVVFQALFERYGEFKNTYGANLVAQLKAHNFTAKNRNYDSCIQAALFDDNIPVGVYENLIQQIHANLPTLHRFLELKKRMLGVDTLHYFDLYAPLVSAVDMVYSVDQSKAVLNEALGVMGEEYLTTLNRAFDDRWIDFMPTAGKRSGAYSSGAAYDVHPYILMNWNEDYDSLTTLTHELGHTMHSHFSNTYQPFSKSHYSIFVAEIASTFNENLLNRYLVDKAKDDEARLFLLGSYLEHIRTTVFRQTQFAEFEWEIHKAVEAGKPLTGDSLSAMYMGILKKYYGHDKGVCVVDDENAYEWCYIPHFYYDFYVFQYATSQIYSTAFAQKVMDQGKPAVESYFKLLKGGGSEYPLDIIRTAGLDPLSSEPFDLAMKTMNSVMNQIESLLDKK